MQAFGCGGGEVLEAPNCPLLDGDYVVRNWLYQGGIRQSSWCGLVWSGTFRVYYFRSRSFRLHCWSRRCLYRLWSWFQASWLLCGCWEKCPHLLQQFLHLGVVVHQKPDEVCSGWHPLMPSSFIIKRGFVDDISRLSYKFMELAEDGLCFVLVFLDSSQLCVRRPLESPHSL